MKYFIISDIHSNFEALNAILDYKKQHFPDAELICLGDIVGYGANPNECVDTVFENTDKIIMGNHDAGVIGLTDINYFNFTARKAIQWTKKKLTKENIKRISSMVLNMKIDNFHIVHSSPVSPNEWEYIFSIYAAQKEFDKSACKVLFFGHTHLPMIFEYKDENTKLILKTEYKLLSEFRYMINPGSIGQPRNQDPRASAILYDYENSIIKYIKVNYDIEKAAHKIINAGLPEFLAKRLWEGL